MEDLETLAGCRALAERIKRDAERGMIILSPFEFARAVEMHLIEYAERKAGISMGGSYVGEMQATMAGRAVTISDA